MATASLHLDGDVVAITVDTTVPSVIAVGNAASETRLLSDVLKDLKSQVGEALTSFIRRTEGKAAVDVDDAIEEANGSGDEEEVEGK